jgi:hypothetical protein
LCGKLVSDKRTEDYPTNRETNLEAQDSSGTRAIAGTVSNAKVCSSRGRKYQQSLQQPKKQRTVELINVPKPRSLPTTVQFQLRAFIPKFHRAVETHRKEGGEEFASARAFVAAFPNSPNYQPLHTLFKIKFFTDFSRNKRRKILLLKNFERSP